MLKRNFRYLISFTILLFNNSRINQILNFLSPKSFSFVLSFVLSFFLTNIIFASENFLFSGKIKCELSATFVVFDFDNKIAIRNNYYSVKYKLSNYETKNNKFRKSVHTFSWHDEKNNFLGYWVLSNDSKNILEIKFDNKGNVFYVNRICSALNNNNIGELIWE